eukprot:CAMPEP_0183431158 /NCGR_PEP_ID=MMETSP0370-20130417/54639_1 /TAXON_ID=268820 /ORGANISM="Peridinium aciculiferum, Strain PAER-2" /LENGTH=70 /DNA_ID=CAMNT_0025616775 /DNA_START=57 /DNA_END=266 /DNA_ORIENTATION=+
MSWQAATLSNTPRGAASRQAQDSLDHLPPPKLAHLRGKSKHGDRAPPSNKVCPSPPTRSGARHLSQTGSL